jgi:hypothetical protein
MDTNMQAWLGVTPSTFGRALVVPDSLTDVDLNMGEFAWRRILAHLMDLPGVTTLHAAVDKANDDIDNTNWVDDNNNPIPRVHWHVTGDGSVHF